jgi:hypothetical protein
MVNKVNKTRNRSLYSPIYENRLKHLQIDLSKHMRINFKEMWLGYLTHCHQLRKLGNASILFDNGSKIGKQ